MLSVTDEEMPIFNGSKEQNVKRWLEGYYYFCEANGWDKDTRYTLAHLYLGGEARKWFDKVKDSIGNMDQFEVEIVQRFGKKSLISPYYYQLFKDNIKKKEEYRQETAPADMTNDNRGEAETKWNLFSTTMDLEYKSMTFQKCNNEHLYPTPLGMVKKIKRSPPNTSIANTFFMCCLQYACHHGSRVYLKDHITKIFNNKNLSKDFKTYLSQQFSLPTGEGYSLRQLSVIGHLILCGFPEGSLFTVDAYRRELGSANIFDADIDRSHVSEPAKEILKEIASRSGSKENGKLCGYIMSSFMKKCISDIPLPDIDYLTMDTSSLTASQKESLN